MSTNNKNNRVAQEHNAKVFAEFLRLVHSKKFEEAYELQKKADAEIQSHGKDTGYADIDDHMLNAYGAFIASRERLLE